MGQAPFVAALLFLDPSKRSFHKSDAITRRQQLLSALKKISKGQSRINQPLAFLNWRPRGSQQAGLSAGVASSDYVREGSRQASLDANMHA